MLRALKNKRVIKNPCAVYLRAHSVGFLRTQAKFLRTHNEPVMNPLKVLSEVLKNLSKGSQELT